MSARARALLAGLTLALAATVIEVVASQHLFRQSGTLSGWLLCASLAAIAIGWGSVWIVSSRAVHPFDTLSKTMEQFGRGDLAVRAHVRGGADSESVWLVFSNLMENALRQTPSCASAQTGHIFFSR